MEKVLYELPMVIVFMSIILYKGSTARVVNVALKKPSMQSTTFESIYRAELANDGIISRSAVIKNKCTHTRFYPFPNEWWMVNLEQLYYIHKIVLYGRTSDVERFQDFNVDVIAPNRSTGHLKFDTVDLGHVTFRHYVQFPTTKVQIDCPNKPLGQLVRVQHRGKRILTLCEVTVLGEFAACLKAADISKHVGITGRRYKGETIEVLPADSPLHCIAICKNVDCCYAANFNLNENQCEITKKMKSEELVTDKNGILFFLY